MRDSCIFYRSFLDAIELLPKKYQLGFYKALFNYALNDEAPKNLAGSAAALFKALQPQIDANNRKFENGKKGGRPKKPNNNQDETKPKPNDNQTITKAEPNVNVNSNLLMGMGNGSGSQANASDSSPKEEKLYFFADID